MLWFAVWFAVSFAAWWLYVAELSLVNLYLGLGLSLLAAASGTLLTGSGLVDGRSLARSLRVTPAVVRATAVDFGLVTVRLAQAVRRGERGPVGVLIRRPVDVADELGPGVRSWMTVSATVSPNSCVIDIDPVSRQVLLHDVVPRRSSESPA